MKLEDSGNKRKIKVQAKEVGTTYSTTHDAVSVQLVQNLIAHQSSNRGTTVSSEHATGNILVAALNKAELPKSDAAASPP
jgi:hypothetical protein